MSNFKVPFFIKVTDCYLKRPLTVDLIFTILFLGGLYYITDVKCLSLIDDEILKSLNSDLIATSISLAGFVLASLTIIVTFKDSVNGKQTIGNGRDLFFKSKHYYPTVRIFYQASVILLFLFLFLSVSKIYKGAFMLEARRIVTIGSLILVTTTIFRSLYLLLQIIKLQVKDMPTE